MFFFLICGGSTFVNATTGYDLLYSGDFSGAVDEFTEELELLEGTDKAPFLNNIGTCYMATGDPVKAIKYYEKAVVTDPDYHQGWINLGVVQEKTGDYESALKSFDKITNANPEFYGDALIKKGTLLSSLGRLEEAKKTFFLIEDWASEQKLAEMYIGIGAIALVEQNMDEAEKSFLKAIELDPEGSVMAWNNLGVLYVTQGKFNQAKIAFENAVNCDTDGITNAALFLKNLEKLN